MHGNFITMAKSLIEINQELKNVQERKQNVYNAQVAASKEGRETSKDFYYRLVLLSGGVISLSITFLGYLISVQKYIIVYPEILIIGWASLLICVFASMYRNHIYSNFVHWQLGKMYSESSEAVEKTTLEFLQTYPGDFVNLRNDPDALATAITTSTHNITVYKTAAKKNKKKEKRGLKMWVALQNVAHISFIVGMTLVIVFAAINIPHAKYSYIHWSVPSVKNHTR